VTAIGEVERMKADSPDRTGLLIVRLWIDGSPHDGLRARITQTLDSAESEQTTGASASPEGIYAAVRTWVEAFVRSEKAVSDVTVTRDYETRADD
jgi:hypothetical protein